MYLNVKCKYYENSFFRNITFKCKVLPVEAKKPKFIPEKVEHFKDRLLYGGRIRREKNSKFRYLFYHYNYFCVIYFLLNPFYNRIVINPVSGNLVFLIF